MTKRNNVILDLIGVLVLNFCLTALVCFICHTSPYMDEYNVNVPGDTVFYVEFSEPVRMLGGRYLNYENADSFIVPENYLPKSRIIWNSYFSSHEDL